MTTTPTPETTTNTGEPAAWIGCLSCYNNGHLRGAWITAGRAEIENYTQITYGNTAEQITTGERTVTVCNHCNGDEFDVFDTEHLPTKMGVREFYANAETLAALDADELERLTTLAGWLGGSMSLADLIAYDQENYVGEYSTFQDYAEQYADEVALLADTPEWIARYFDMEAFARDLAHDYYHDDTTGHTWRSV